MNKNEEEEKSVLIKLRFVHPSSFFSIHFLVSFFLSFFLPFSLSSFLVCLPICSHKEMKERMEVSFHRRTGITHRDRSHIRTKL